MDGVCVWFNNCHKQTFIYLRHKIYINQHESVHMSLVELVWRSSSVMDCHAAAQGSIPGWNGVFTELHVLRKGQ